jgi:hypothetical protein
MPETGQNRARQERNHREEVQSESLTCSSSSSSSNNSRHAAVRSLCQGVRCGHRRISAVTVCGDRV